MLVAIDDVLGFPWRMLLRLLTKLIGQTNLFFALAAMYAAVSAAAIDLDTVKPQHETLHATVLIVVVCAILVTHGHMERLKRQLDDPGDMLQLDAPSNLAAALALRLSFSAAAIVMCAPFNAIGGVDYLEAGCFFFLAAWQYFLIDYYGRGKSVVGRVRAWLKAHRSSFGLPRALPQPG